MNVSTPVNYVWWVAAGGAAGAVLHHLVVTVASPRIDAGRVRLALTTSACLLLGIVVASGRDGSGYAFIGVGLLASVAPFTGFAWRAAVGARHGLRLAVWTVLASVSMAIVGYILADTGSIAFEKFPGSRG